MSNRFERQIDMLEEQGPRGLPPRSTESPSRLPVIVGFGTGLILIGIGFLLFQQLDSYPEGVPVRTGPPDRYLRQDTCEAVAYSAYRGIVAHIREHGRPPETLDEIVGPYLHAPPLDPRTGRPLLYASDGKVTFRIGCPG